MDNKEEATEESMQSDALLRILNQQLTAAYQRDPKNITEVPLPLPRSPSNASSRSSRTRPAAASPNSPTSWSSRTSSPTSRTSRRPTSRVPPLPRRLPRAVRRTAGGEDRQAEYLLPHAEKKEKKSELSNYDRIVSGNFKKKTEEKCYLEVEEPRAVRRSKEKDRRSKEKDRLDSNRKDKNPSNDNKLNRLFSKEKNQLREGGLKDSARVAEDQPLNQTAVHAQDESVSFSSVLATSVAVKSRRRKGSTEGKKEKAKVEEDRHKEKEEGDEAFIFYRPKKGKK